MSYNLDKDLIHKYLIYMNLRNFILYSTFIDLGMEIASYYVWGVNVKNCTRL